MEPKTPTPGKVQGRILVSSADLRITKRQKGPKKVKGSLWSVHPYGISKRLQTSAIILGNGAPYTNHTKTVLRFHCWYVIFLLQV